MLTCAVSKKDLIKNGVPIILMLIDHPLELSFECLIESLIETVCLWVVCTSYIVLKASKFLKAVNHLVAEFLPLICDDISWATMLEKRCSIEIQQR